MVDDEPPNELDGLILMALLFSLAFNALLFASELDLLRKEHQTANFPLLVGSLLMGVLSLSAAQRVSGKYDRDEKDERTEILEHISGRMAEINGLILGQSASAVTALLHENAALGLLKLLLTEEVSEESAIASYGERLDLIVNVMRKYDSETLRETCPELVALCNEHWDEHSCVDD
ncbi:MAG: hypothetical protein WCT21_00585 [Patescibacteria group bacterium]|jgi:hypothetical protein